MDITNADKIEFGILVTWIGEVYAIIRWREKQCSELQSTEDAFFIVRFLYEQNKVEETKEDNATHFPLSSWPHHW